jgi:hypothetical protein
LVTARNELPSQADVLTARPVLLGVKVREGSAMVEAEAELQIGDRFCRAVSSQPIGHAEMAVASATLRAVEQAKPVTMAVCETMYADAVTSKVGVVVVDMNGMLRPLTGSAIFDEEDGVECFARAALDAINRIITDERLLNETVRSAQMHLG